MLFFYRALKWTRLRKKFWIGLLTQGILKGEVSLYHWPPVWLVWNQLYDNWQFLFLFSKQTNPNQSNWRSIVQWYFPLQFSLTYSFCKLDLFEMLKYLSFTSLKWSSLLKHLINLRPKSVSWLLVPMFSNCFKETTF